MSRIDLTDRITVWLAELGHAAETRSIDVLSRCPGSEILCIRLDGPRDTPSFVLRRILSTDWLRREPDLAAREATALRLAERLPLPTPRLTSLDVDGYWTGVPGVLMSLLPGNSWPTGLRPGRDTLVALAHWLRIIHNPDFAKEAVTGLPSYRPHHWPQVLSAGPPAWTRYPEAWKDAARIARAWCPMPSCSTDRLLHRDYRLENLLWDENRPVAVIDWITACHGDPGADLGHCRWNLCRIWGSDVMRVFTEAYGSGQVDPIWDILAAIGGLPDMAPTSSKEADHLDYFIKQALSCNA